MTTKGAVTPVDNPVGATTFAPLFGTMGAQLKTAPAGNRRLAHHLSKQEGGCST